ncbi:hypothetical protein D0Q02_24090 [Micromonospora craniellae]|uniref:Transposase DDE domain-containing protein n=1 Tax=Micromonospora craniellae TaxID=2294034 RepID=A0A372FTI0_9ACTN|nr:hypothetical protein ID554_10475 [Micromonospora craniellae]RFS44055.1 hypothetical protein D0Q02_24090 [Micromonospora craniellae]
MCQGNRPARFGKRPTEKDPHHGHLAGGPLHPCGRVRKTDLEQSRHRARARPNTFAWFTGYRRLTIRYERNPGLYCAFVALAAALTCHKLYLKLTT